MAYNNRARHSGGRRDFSGDRGPRRDFRDSAPREMFSVECAECGKDSKVPFKPTGDRPVFCSDCFERRGSGGRDTRDSGSRNRAPRMDDHKEQFEALHAKLDKIMRLLNPEVKAVVTDKPKAKVKKTKKKASKKK